MSEEEFTADVVTEQLRNVIDPEIQYNIVDLGLVYDVKVNGTVAGITMTLTTPACPFGPMILHDTRECALAAGAEDVEIELVWQPPWSPDMMSDEAKLDLGFDL